MKGVRFNTYCNSLLKSPPPLYPGRHDEGGTPRRRPQQFLLCEGGRHEGRDHATQVHRVWETPAAPLRDKVRLCAGRDTEWKDVHHGRPPSGVCMG